MRIRIQFPFHTIQQILHFLQKYLHKPTPFQSLLHKIKQFQLETPNTINIVLNLLFYVLPQKPTHKTWKSLLVVPSFKTINHLIKIYLWKHKTRLFTSSLNYYSIFIIISITISPIHSSNHIPQTSPSPISTEINNNFSHIKYIKISLFYFFFYTNNYLLPNNLINIYPSIFC
jgi:hypothetical protein